MNVHSCGYYYVQRVGISIINLILVFVARTFGEEGIGSEDARQSVTKLRVYVELERLENQRESGASPKTIVPADVSVCLLYTSPSPRD